MREVASSKPENRIIRRTPPREQRRAIDTRAAILEAALSEFAEKGYSGSSIRAIAERCGVQHQVITYHFPTKDVLWESVARDVFNTVWTIWSKWAPDADKGDPITRLRQGYRAIFQTISELPQIHHFIRQEVGPANPRSRWIAEEYLAPITRPLMDDIRVAQEMGALPEFNSVLVHYMLNSIVSTLSTFGPDMKNFDGVDSNDPKVIDEYWSLVDEMIFKPASERVHGAGLTDSKD